LFTNGGVLGISTQGIRRNVRLTRLSVSVVVKGLISSLIAANVGAQDVPVYTTGTQDVAVYTVGATDIPVPTVGAQDTIP
jgi:hypothetical protein